MSSVSTWSAQSAVRVTESVECYTDPARLDSLMQPGTVLSQSPSSTVTTVVGMDDDDAVVKTGPGVYQSEYRAMELIRAGSIVQCPRPIAYSARSHDSPVLRRGYLVMQKLPGVTLSRILGGLTDANCEHIGAQLRDVVQKLERTVVPEPRYGMLGKNGQYHRGHFNYRPGPCVARSVWDMAIYFLAAYNPDWEQSAPGLEALKRLEAAADLTRPLVLNHGDLCPENILIDPTTLRLTGIIDWEFAGWYPYFWNYLVACRAIARFAHGASNWEKIFNCYTERYDAEALNMLALMNNAADYGWQESALALCTCCS